eukprot:tig00020930_g16015.t1
MRWMQEEHSPACKFKNEAKERIAAHMLDAGAELWRRMLEVIKEVLFRLFVQFFGMDKGGGSNIDYD